jgi:superfamily II DNA or RNA helicase
MNHNKFDITKEFKKYIVQKSTETMEDFCLPKKFKFQPQQIFLRDFLSSKFSPWLLYNNDIRGTLLYHQIGAGKTCTAICIAEQFKKKLKIIVVLSAALIGNFMDELKSSCTNNEYVTDEQHKLLTKLSFNDPEYKQIISKIHTKISKYYTIYSYHKFIALIQNKDIQNLNNTLLIVDEIQNMISLNGTFYKLLSYVINKSNDTLKILLMSATPMFDKPLEIALTLNLLKKNNPLPILNFNQTYIKTHHRNYNITNTNDLFDKIKNLISYYRGAPPQAYPDTIFKIIKCQMSDFQYKSYLTSLSSEQHFIRGSFKDVDILNLPQNFFLGPRMISNIAFPNKSIGEIGYNSFKEDNLKLKNIKRYSIKFYKIMNKISKADGLIFVYSNFKDLGGIKCFIKFIEYHGWKNYKTNKTGNKIFAIWSGSESLEYKNEIKYVFNQKHNSNGSKIKLMIGSPSIKEGISLLRIQQVHIIEPYWNMARILQIMGRAVRFCSHKDMPKNKRFVEIYLYLSTYPNEKTIDEYIWSLAKKKYKLINQFELILKEAAFDCNIFINRNSYPNDLKQIECKN